MTDRWLDRYKALSLDAQIVIDELCSRYEASLQAGEAPSLEVYLQESSVTDPAGLLAELVAIDVTYRRRRGERPASSDYTGRFPDFTAVIAEVFAEDQSPTHIVSHPRVPGLPQALPTIAGYEVRGELGQGGMGVVLQGRDAAVGRDVAVKVLRDEHRDRTELRRRFLEEGRITGRLQHPGVVPVYGLGRLADGRPYFTMKLVQGRTLAELLAARAGPGQDRPRLLKVFEQVCQALAYAHAQGVIHRDLKPANVMVGAFGEVQVMDWGLAKVVPPAPAGAGSRPRAAGGGDSPTACGGSGETQAGTVLGTPGYMAPEQARGEADGLDERCDVFGLGAILCAILTGQPPFGGGTPEERMRQAARGELADAFARLDGCGADAELVALARRCLAAERADRPANAGVLAAQLAAYLESVEARLRRAELERAQAEVKAAEGRKRQRVQLGLAGALLLLVLGGGAGAWLWQRRGQEVDRAVEGALGKARLLWEQAKATPLGDPGQFRLAWEAARQAEELARASGSAAALRREAEGLARTLKEEADAAARDRVLLAALLEAHGPREEGRFQKDEKGLMVELAPPSADEQFREAFRAWGLDVDATPTSAAAARLSQRPAAVVVEVVAGLDQWAGERRRQGRPRAECERPAALARALDDDPGSRRRELRAMLARGHLERERALGLLALALRPVPVPFDAGWGADRSRLRQLAATTDVSTEPVLGLLTLVRALRGAGDDAGAQDLLRAAVRARPREVGLHHALGHLLAGQRRWREAAESYATVRALRSELGVSLAHARVKAGEVREGLALFERLSAERQGDPWVYIQLGIALSNDLQRHKEAEAALRRAIRLKADFPIAHNSLGIALYGQGRHKEAEAALRQAIRLELDFPEAHYNLGIALSGQGRVKETEGAYRQAIRLKPDSPDAHCNLGTALRDQGKFADALAALRLGHQLGSKRPGWPYPSADWVRQCEQLVELDRLLPKIRRGEAEPTTAADCLELAWLCQRPSKRLHVAAARFAAAAFAADPKLANDFRQQHRYAAACSAALAAAGQGADARLLPAKFVPALRRQALTWLRADLGSDGHPLPPGPRPVPQGPPRRQGQDRPDRRPHERRPAPRRQALEGYGSLDFPKPEESQGRVLSGARPAARPGGPPRRHGAPSPAARFGSPPRPPALQPTRETTRASAGTATTLRPTPDRRIPAARAERPPTLRQPPGRDRGGLGRGGLAQRWLMGDPRG
jgi:eukaryotic-like serine/threonine-protein kinase